MLSLSLKKLVTCGVIRSFNFGLMLSFRFLCGSFALLDWLKLVVFLSLPCVPLHHGPHPES